MTSNNSKKCLTISIQKNQNNCISIIVSDNGIGISAENITRLFFGFSTKQKGYGFGLHNSALLAKELGDLIEAKSDGIGTGAIFTLTLPITANSVYKKKSDTPQE